MKTITHTIIILPAGLPRAISGPGEKMFLVLPERVDWLEMEVERLTQLQSDFALVSKSYFVHLTNNDTTENYKNKCNIMGPHNLYWLPLHLVGTVFEFYIE
jgi:hypothetical protein